MALHPFQILYLRGTESIDTLIRVSNDCNSFVFSSKELHEIILHDVCVLELINKDSFHVRHTGRVESEQLGAFEKQVIVVQKIRVGQSRLIFLEDLNEFLLIDGLCRLCRNVGGLAALGFLSGDS